MFDFGESLADLAVMIADKKIKDEFEGLPGRQRPRDPKKKETLLRWEEERGGVKIGLI